MEIFVVRHGESEGNRDNKFRGRTDFPLTERGRSQAEETGKELTKFGKFDVIFTSPLIRAKETAEIISKFLKTNVIPVEELNNIKLGEWEGKSKNFIKENYPEEWRLWITEPEKLKIKNGEEIDHIRERTMKWIRKTVEENYERILIVTHRAVIKPMLAGILDVNPPYFWKFHIDTCSYSIVKYERGIFSLHLLNYTNHLSSLTVERF